MSSRGGGGRRGGYQQPTGRGGGDQEPTGRGGVRHQQPTVRGGSSQQPTGRAGGRDQQTGRGGRYGGGGDAGGIEPHVYNVPPKQQPSAFQQVQSLPYVPTAPGLSEATHEFDKLNVRGADSTSASSSSAPPAVASVEIPDTRLKEVSPVSSKFVRRPNNGTSGTSCVIKANHFRVKFADRDIHHYDVSITPEVLSKKVCRDILKALTTEYKSHLGGRNIAYDGRKSIYVAGSLPFVSQTFKVKLSGGDGSRRERDFKVEIKFVAKPDLHQLQEFLNRKQFDAPQETIQALDVVLREAPSDLYVAVGRSFFSPMLGDKGELGEGLDYWVGFYQSIRPTQMGLSLNIDISARPFFEPILVTDFIAKYLNLRVLTRPLSEQDRLKVKKALRGVKVEIAHPLSVRRYKITGVSNQPLNRLSFSVDGSGTEVSITSYFLEKYNISLRHGNLPALQAGNDARPAYLPMECCKIVEGQRYSKRLNEKQVSVLLKATCQRPNIREQKIKQMVERNDYNRNILVNKEFGLQVSTELTTIKARVLSPPKLRYRVNKSSSVSVVPSVGQWSMSNKKLIVGGRLHVWACVNLSRVFERDVVGFCQELIATCINKGMDCTEEPMLPIASEHPGEAEKLLDYIHNECNKTKKRLDLLVVILPDATGLYGTIKRVCETQLGIVTQCCMSRNVTKPNRRQYLENLALKINVKVGGTNVHLDQNLPRKDYLRDMPTIVFGADVTHPQPGDDTSSSIAAVVASMDWPDVTKYRCLVSAQSHRQEIINDLYTCVDNSKNVVTHGGMIREHLKNYYNSTGRKPNRIIFYRDGVSEGQFSQVLLHEVDAIRKACMSLQENYLPPITFVVVQKRHHTRLFADDHRDNRNIDKSGNIMPGTVVDVEICHPNEFDFYLCSHAGIQGTSRPTHYHVLHDENNFSADELQVLTNNLCYTYVRCTRSVSLVPPAYYAHLAAFRARHYVEGRTSDGDSNVDGGRGRGGAVEVRSLPGIKDKVNEVMFYC